LSLKVGGDDRNQKEGAEQVHVFDSSESRTRYQGILPTQKW
jgi:hypothetical protein